MAVHNFSAPDMTVDAPSDAPTLGKPWRPMSTFPKSGRVQVQLGDGRTHVVEAALFVNNSAVHWREI